MISHLIPFISTEMYRHLPDQTTEILNRLITEVNENRLTMAEMTNAIVVLRQQVADLEKAQPVPPTPTPTGEWSQVLAFNPADMGTVAGECLKNVRLGFGIQTGTFPSAYADMVYQRNNGTLHAEDPPMDVAVPVYCGSGTPNGHVVAWDHGVVYSDGVLVPEGLNHWSVIYGWGECCDNVRVVQRIQ